VRNVKKTPDMGGASRQSPVSGALRGLVYPQGIWDSSGISFPHFPQGFPHRKDMARLKNAPPDMGVRVGKPGRFFGQNFWTYPHSKGVIHSFPHFIHNFTGLLPPVNVSISGGGSLLRRDDAVVFSPGIEGFFYLVKVGIQGFQPRAEVVSVKPHHLAGFLPG